MAYNWLFRSSVFCWVTIISIGSLSAQRGTIKGQVVAASGDVVPFASILLIETGVGTTSDLDGYFQFAVAAGTYRIITTSIGYLNDTLKISIADGETKELLITLRENIKEITQIDVTGTKVTNTESALILETKKSEQIVTGISSQQIAKTQDRDAGDVLRRVPGITIMQNRFVLIRGLSERYNMVLLNDAVTPSSEVDKKAFSFDMIPSGALDRIIIYKTGAPEFPGEFAGGVIKLFTKNAADEDQLKFSFSTSFRTNTTFQTFYNGGINNTDWLGFDNGDRSLPGAFPENLRKVISSDNVVQYGRMLPNTWKANQETAMPDFRTSVFVNKNFLLRKNVRIANVTSIGYSYENLSYTASNFAYNVFDSTTQSSSKIYEYNDDTYDIRSRIGLIHNWAFSFGENKIEFRNFFNQMGSNSTVIRTGPNYEESQDLLNNSYRYVSRSIYSGQFQGNHDFTGGSGLNWIAGFSKVFGNEPDYRRIRTRKVLGSDDPYQVIISPAASTLDAGRFYSELDEYIVSGGLNYSHKIKVKKSGHAITLRMGVYGEYKNRVFDARWLSYTIAKFQQFDNSLLFQPIEDIFSTENINDSTGFNIQEGTNPSDHYDAINQLYAGYIGASVPIKNKWNISGGARLEYNRQELESKSSSNRPIVVDNPILSILPSLNVAYNLTDNMLIRAAYSMTVNRPEFRELAPFSFYDFNWNWNISGNENLETPSIHNADLRWEFYPGRNEVINVAVFYKNFQNPIEMLFVPGSGSGGTKDFTFGNADNSYSIGAEVEVRKSLASFIERGFFKDFGLLLNGAYIHSRVNLGDKAIAQSDNRPMMGQSPFIVNTGLFYENSDKKWQANLLYNVIGKRIFAVGTSINPDYYEMPRHQLDFNISKIFGKYFEFKLAAQNLLNQPVRIIQDSDSNNRIDDIDELIMEYKTGIYFTIGFELKFIKS